MNAIVNIAPGKLAWQELSMPEPAPGQVRVRTVVCGICTTDLEMIAGWERTSFPSVPGHEWSGVVDALGEGVDASLVGRRCVADNVLTDGGEVGFEHPGGYAECFLTEARNVRVLPDDLPLASAALIEPLAVCVRGLARLGLEDRRSALVFGDGPIGLILLMLLARAGVNRLCLVGGRPLRLALARELTGAKTLNYHESGSREAFEETFPNVIEASGSVEAMRRALDAAATGGKVLVLGDYADARADFRWNHVLHRELEIIGSNASAGAWDEAVRLAVEEARPLERLISHRLPARDFARGVEIVRTGRDAIKVILEWQR